jgi:hypothetical protein
LKRDTTVKNTRQEKKETEETREQRDEIGGKKEEKRD